MTIAAAIILLACVAALIVAASLPQLYPVWMAREVDTIAIVHDNLRVWQVDTAFFLVSAVGAALGAGLLFGGVRGDGTALALTSLILLGIGTTLWCVNLAFRFSTTAAVARDLGGATPQWYPYLVRLSVSVWHVAAIFLGLTLIGLGVLILVFDVLDAWSGWVTLGIAAVHWGTLAVTRDAPPLLFYLTPAAWGIAALV